MSQRYFNNTSSVGSLTGPIASSATSILTTNFTGTPTAPFTVTIDRNTPSEEVCLVTAIAGGTLTVVRGYDGTAGQAHSAGATVEHTAGAIEYTEANAHNNATTNVHGSTGSVVGNQGAQTIYDKTLVSPVCQADVTKGDAVVAYTPPGTAVRNLFSGKGTDGNTKFTVDSSGNVTGAGVNLTTLNTTVTGNTTAIAGKADKTYVDSQDTALGNRITTNETTLGAATSSGTANTLVKRDGLGTFSALAVTLGTDPTQPLQAATRQYVDARATLPDTAWRAVTYTNGWADDTTHGPATRYRKLSNNQVEVQGAIKSGTIGSGTPAFTLPAGFRPGGLLVTTQLGNDVLARVDFRTDGTVAVISGSSAVYTTVHATFYQEN